MRLNASEMHVEKLRDGEDPKTVIKELRGSGAHFIAAVKTVARGLDLPIDKATLLVRQTGLWEGEFEFADDPADILTDAGAKPG